MTDREAGVVAVLDAWRLQCDADSDARAVLSQVLEEVLDMVDPQVPCPECAGKGRGMESYDDEFGSVELDTECEQCDGSGKCRGSVA